MNILQALQDPALFGRLPRFRDLSSWTAWMVFLKALFALALTEEELDLYRRCTGRQDPPAREASEAAAVVGRRGGKSQIAALIAVFLAFFLDWRPHLAAGERVHVVLIAQNMRAARVVLGYIRGILRAIPAFARQVEAERSDEIDLKNLVTIGVWTATYRSTRGITIGVAILDEVDFWWQESLNAAEEVVASVRPAMASLPGAKLIAISSPYTPTGWLHRFWQEHWARDDGTLIWKAASRVMNPTLSAARIAAALAEDPERARAEWEAEWRAGAAAFLDPAQVDACVRTEPLVIPPRVGVGVPA